MPAVLERKRENFVENFRFPSIARPDYAYEIHSEYEYRRNATFSSHISEFQTLGDGMTQHSPCSGISIENWLDASVSLASAMAANPDPAFHGLVADIFPLTPARKNMEFAFSVKFIENKRRFFSVREQKISVSEKLQYDTRYAEIHEETNGTTLSAFRILSKGIGCDGLTRLQLLEILREYSDERGNGYYSVSNELEAIGYMGIADMTIYRNLRDALAVIGCFVQAFRSADIAQRQFSCLKNNYIDRLSHPAEAEVAA